VFAKREQAPALQKNGQSAYRLACLFPNPILSLAEFFSQKIDEFYFKNMFRRNAGSIP
jgi:hypothetical protein